MSSCGRDDDDDDGVLEATPAPKTKAGGCCSTSTDARASAGGSCNSAACACAPTTDASATAPLTTAMLGASLSHTDHAALVTAHAIVPPKRAVDARPIGRRPMCSKCKTAPAQVNLRDQVNCAACFTHLFVAKVKSTLRLKCALPKAAQLLVAVSGGASSACLARVLHIACDPSADRRLFFGFDLIHIDESAIALGTEEEKARHQREVRQLFAQYNGRFISVPIEEVMNICTDEEATTASSNDTSVAAATAAASAGPSTSSAASLSSSDPNFFSLPVAHLSAHRLALQQMFASLKDSSDKSDLLGFLRLRLLAHVARSQGYASVVLGDNATHTACAIFADTAKGRGATVPLRSLFRETRFQTDFLYPVREQNNQPMALYNHFQTIRPVIRATFTTATKKSAQTGATGINKLTHDFLCMLDSKFNSTVSNIFNTVDKLAHPQEFALYAGSTTTPPPPITADSHCSLCGRPRIAAEFAENERTRHAGVGAMHLRTLKPENKAILDAIPTCYGCEALARELADAALIPTYIRVGVLRDHRHTTATAASSSSSSSSGASTYPAAFRSLQETGSAKSHAARAETNRAKKMREQEAEAGGDEDAAGGTNTAHSSGHAHGELHKQSREDMRASFAEFVLPEE